MVSPVTLQYRARVKNRGAIVFEDKSVRYDIRLKKNGNDALQLFAFGTGLRVMGRIVFFRFQV